MNSNDPQDPSPFQEEEGCPSIWALFARAGLSINSEKSELEMVGAKALAVTITVRTPTLCIPDTSDRPSYFFFNLLNLATPLLSYAVRLVLLYFVLLSSLSCYHYDVTLILTLGYRLFTNTYVS